MNGKLYNFQSAIISDLLKYIHKLKCLYTFFKKYYSGLAPALLGHIYNDRKMNLYTNIMKHYLRVSHCA